MVEKIKYDILSWQSFISQKLTEWYKDNTCLNCDRFPSYLHMVHAYNRRGGYCNTVCQDVLFCAAITEVFTAAWQWMLCHQDGWILFIHAKEEYCITNDVLFQDADKLCIA